MLKYSISQKNDAQRIRIDYYVDPARTQPGTCRVYYYLGSLGQKARRFATGIAYNSTEGNNPNPPAPYCKVQGVRLPVII